MAERRSSTRVTPSKELPAKVRAFLPARVVDISRTGVQLELSSLLRVGVVCDVRLSLGEEELRWPATVCRCRASSFGVDASGQKVLLYRAGLQFAPMSDQEWEHLERFLRLAEGPHTGIELAAGEVPPTAQPGPSSERAASERSGPIKVKVDTSQFRR